MEKKRILPNGIELFSYRADGTHSFFLSLFLRAGSMYEREGESGITHFFEHIAIRNINKLMGGELYSLLDREGIEFNASTFGEMVQFYVSGSPESLPTAARIMAHLFSPIVLSRDEIDAERGRIKAEIRELDEASSLAAIAAREVYCGTTLARPITGTLGEVSKISARSLEEFRRHTFIPENLFFYLTGAFTEDDLDTLASAVGHTPLSFGEPHTNIAPVPDKFGKRGGSVLIKNADFTRVKLSFDIDMSRVGVPECDLLYEHLFGGYSSRMFIELSERRGLLYDISGSVERYKNIGVFGFSFEIREAKLELALETVVEILRDLKKNPPAPERCMKAGFVKNAAMLLDDPRELNFTLAYDNHILALGYSSLEERVAAYDAVTPEALSRAAAEIFTVSNLTLTVKGNKNRIKTERLADIISLLGAD